MGRGRATTTPRERIAQIRRWQEENAEVARLNHDDWMRNHPGKNSEYCRRYQERVSHRLHGSRRSRTT